MSDCVASLREDRIRGHKVKLRHPEIMGNKKRGSRRNPKWLKCRDCGFEPEFKMVRRDCRVCGGFMRVKR